MPYYIHENDDPIYLNAYKLMLEDWCDETRDNLKEVNKIKDEANFVDSGLIARELDLKRKKIQWYTRLIAQLDTIIKQVDNSFSTYSGDAYKPQDDDTPDLLITQCRVMENACKYLKDRIDALTVLGEQEGEIRLLKLHKQELTDMFNWFYNKRAKIDLFLQIYDFDGVEWYKK